MDGHAISLCHSLRCCHELLIEPFISELEHESRLLIFPDRDLHALLFCALLDQDGKYLIKKHMLSVAPSVGTVLELERHTAGATHADDVLHAVVVSDPNFSGRMPQLCRAQREAQDVFRILDNATSGDGNVTLLLSKDATKACMLDTLREANYAHFMTHGSPDGVFLSGESDSAGKLTMAEVQELELLALKLVVLTSCDSFRGSLHADGVVGIARAFLTASASTLLASLWKVDDTATHELMTRFYEQLVGDSGGDVATALQEAMISMVHKGCNVSKWAAFSVYSLGFRTLSANDEGEVVLVMLMAEVTNLFEEDSDRSWSNLSHALFFSHGDDAKPTLTGMLPNTNRYNQYAGKHEMECL